MIALSFHAIEATDHGAKRLRVGQARASTEVSGMGAAHVTLFCNSEDPYTGVVVARFIYSEDAPHSVTAYVFPEAPRHGWTVQVGDEVIHVGDFDRDFYLAAFGA